MNSFVLKILSASLALSLSFIASAKDTLYEGESLIKEQSIISNNGCFRLTMQSDGKLILYRNSDGQATWATMTDDNRTYVAKMQYDGNFVTNNYSGVPTWNSGTSGHPHSRLVLSNDGNLRIFDGYSVFMWHSNSTRNCN